MTSRTTSAVVAVSIVLAACGGTIAIRAPQQPPSPDQIKELWIDPGDAPRDLFWGIGGRKYAPAPDAVYKFEDRDDVGFSSSYGVTDKDDVDSFLEMVEGQTGLHVIGRWFGLWGEFFLFDCDGLTEAC